MAGMKVSRLVVVGRYHGLVPSNSGGIAHKGKDRGLKGFDFARRIKGSVPVQAGDHRKRRCNQVSAKVALTPAKVALQSDFALAA